MTVQIVRGDGRRLPIADNTVDLVCTSPPYFALRSYTDQGEHYGGQIGSEGTPQEWLAALLEVTAECVRVLKPSGSLFVNLGDKYATSLHSYNYRDPGIYTRVTPQPDGQWSKSGWKGEPNVQPASQSTGGIGPKSLMGLPWRYTLACIDQLGLILRAEIVWNKPNGLPESVQDRVRRSHESFFHFVLQPRYYSAVDEIREPLSESPGAQAWRRIREPGHGAYAPGDRNDTYTIGGHIPNPLGKLPGSVWTIPSEPLTAPPHLGVDHFAAFPLEWPRRLIRGWCPAQVCSVCGEGRRPVTNVDREPGWLRGTVGSGGQRHNGENVGQAVTNRALHTITGYVCACTPHTDHPGTGEPGETQDERTTGRLAGLRAAGASNRPAMNHLENYRRVGPWREYHHDQWTPPPTTPGVVLDPFGGTGTTALAALALGRDAIHVDLSADYNRIATWRTTNPDQLAKAMQVTRDQQARDNDLYDVQPLFEVS